MPNGRRSHLYLPIGVLKVVIYNDFSFSIQLSNGPSCDSICTLILLLDTDLIWHDVLLGQAHIYYTFQSWFFAYKVVSDISWLSDEAFA